MMRPCRFFVILVTLSTSAIAAPLEATHLPPHLTPPHAAKPQKDLNSPDDLKTFWRFLPTKQISSWSPRRAASFLGNFSPPSIWKASGNSKYDLASSQDPSSLSSFPSQTSEYHREECHDASTLIPPPPRPISSSSQVQPNPSSFKIPSPLLADRPAPIIIAPDSSTHPDVLSQTYSSKEYPRQFHSPVIRESDLHERPKETRGSNGANSPGHQELEPPSSKESRMPRRAIKWLEEMFRKLWASVWKRIQKWYHVFSKRTKPSQSPSKPKQPPASTQDHIQTHTPSSLGHGSSETDENILVPPKDILPPRTRWLPHVSLGVILNLFYSFRTPRTFFTDPFGLFSRISKLHRYFFNPKTSVRLLESTGGRKGTSSPLTEAVALDQPRLVASENNNRILQSDNYQTPVKTEVERLSTFVPNSPEGKLVATVLDQFNTRDIANAIRAAFMSRSFPMRLIATLTKGSTIENILVRILMASVARNFEAKLIRLQVGPGFLQLVNNMIKRKIHQYQS